MIKPILFIDELFLNDQARDRYAAELATYRAILGQQDRLQLTKALLLARLHTITGELLATDAQERAVLLAEQGALSDELSAIPWQIFQNECQRVIAHLKSIWPSNRVSANKCWANCARTLCSNVVRPPDT